ncbi:MAG TPA: DUF4159 domain-containing protein [bacterium]|nr:DUF4159 domain-containing protein [bacterium]
MAGICLWETGVRAEKNETGDLVIARLRYGGGGDWYNDPSAIPNLARYITARTGMPVKDTEARVAIGDERLFSFPVLFMTGHGRISLSDTEAARLRQYLLAGGFLYADDDYGLDPHFRKMMRHVFPDRELVELPFSHGIYRIHFRFEHGLPKIHEHDNKPPQGFGIFDDEGRLMVFYTYETNISDGWVESEIYGNPPEIREAALKMGTNIILWAVMH